VPLGKEVDLGPGHIVLNGDPVGTQPPQQPFPLSVHVYCGQTVAHLSNWGALVICAVLQKKSQIHFL